MFSSQKGAIVSEGLLSGSALSTVYVHRYYAAAFKVLSGFCFAAINGLAKSLTLPVLQIVGLQNLSGALLMMLVMQGIPASLWKNPAYIMRACIALPGTLLWLKAIKALPMGQTVALGFLGPFFTTIGARWFFHEKVTLRKVLAIVLGIMGGILVAHGQSLMTMSWCCLDTRMLLPLLATLFFSLSSLVGKYLAFHEKPQDMACSLMLYIGLFLLPTLPFWELPSVGDMFTLVVMGGLAAFGHFAMSKAMAGAELIFLLPFGSTRFLATTAIGWYFYDQIPTWWVFWGMIVILGGLWALASKKSSS